MCNVPDYGTEDVADHALAMILALERRLLSYNRESYVEMRRNAAEEAHRVLTGNRPLNCVNGQYL